MRVCVSDKYEETLFTHYRVKHSWKNNESSCVPGAMQWKLTGPGDGPDVV